METAESPRNPRRGRPPDDISRVRLFIALAAEYESLVEEFPAPSNFTFGASRDDGDRWSRLVRAFALRKFTLQASDHVYLANVAEALNRLLPPPIERIGLTSARIRQALLEPIHVGEKVIDPSHIVEDMLYGVYLHGDYDRWARRASALRLVDEYSLYVYTLRSEALVRQLREVIQFWAERSALPTEVLPGDSGQPRSQAAGRSFPAKGAGFSASFESQAETSDEAGSPGRDRQLPRRPNLN